jgi:hypothetical protein
LKERQMGKVPDPEPESRASSTGGRFSVSTQESGPSRIDLTISDNDEDMTPYTGHSHHHQLLSMHKVKLEPGPSDLTLPVKVKLEPGTSDLTLPVKVKAEPMFIDLTISDSEDHVSRKHPRSPSPHDLSESSDEDDVGHTWPTDFHVVDVVKGFDRCLKACKTHKSVEKAFFDCFGVPFKSSTFYRHRRKWERASEACRERALRAGHTSAGLWSAFIAHSEVEGHRRKRFKV